MYIYIYIHTHICVYRPAHPRLGPVLQQQAAAARAHEPPRGARENEQGCIAKRYLRILECVCIVFKHESSESLRYAPFATSPFPLSRGAPHGGGAARRAGGRPVLLLQPRWLHPAGGQQDREGQARAPGEQDHGRPEEETLPQEVEDLSPGVGAGGHGPAGAHPLRDLGKGRKGSALLGSLRMICFLSATFWILPLTCFIFPKVPGRIFFPQSVELHCFCRGPISVDSIFPQPNLGLNYVLLLVLVLV